MTAIPQRNYKAGSDIDNCQTPPEATHLIVPYLKRIGVEVIWEPAPGEGLMAGALRDAGFEVVTTTGDFLSYAPDFLFDAIVTNPPYAIDYAFAGRCLSFEKPWALLMKTDREGVSRFREETFCCGVPHYQKIIPSARINYKMPGIGWGEYKLNRHGKKFWSGTAQFHTSWYVHGFGLHSPVLEVEYRQLKRAGFEDEPAGE